MEGPYTRHPRATLWLLEGDAFTMGGEGLDSQPRFGAEASSMYIGKSVIANEEYEVYDPSYTRSPSSPGDHDPAVGIGFRDAVGYCDWYSSATGKAFRLPTEMEWEFACRGLTDTRAFWGDDPAQGEPFAWSVENSEGRLHEIESKRANPFGLHDMLGLVWEWTSSLYRPYPVEPGDGRDDLEHTGDRVLRGGSFREPRAALRSGERRRAAEDTRSDDVGFRIVRLL